MRQGKAIAVAGYAFRAEELETDVQISTATGDLRQLGLDLGGIEEFIRGITVVTPGAPE
jgi:hypothetical protein